VGAENTSTNITQVIQHDPWVLLAVITSSDICIAKVTSPVLDTDTCANVHIYNQSHACPLTYTRDLSHYVASVQLTSIMEVLASSQVTEDEDELLLPEETYSRIMLEGKHDTYLDIDNYLDNTEEEQVLTFSRGGRAVIKPSRYKEGDYY
jgi:hypothetical protein